jgi:hypothetical protein
MVDITAGLFFGGNLTKAIGGLIPVNVDDIMIMSSSVLVASMASRLCDWFKASGHVPVPDTFQYLGMTVTEDRIKR